jgi:hypothetical protein
MAAPVDPKVLLVQEPSHVPTTTPYRSNAVNDDLADGLAAGEPVGLAVGLAVEEVSSPPLQATSKSGRKAKPMKANHFEKFILLLKYVSVGSICSRR